MIKIICDRCEKELEQDGNENEFHFTCKKNTQYGYDKCINLCDKCIEDFKTFIENKK